MWLLRAVVSGEANGAGGSLNFFDQDQALVNSPSRADSLPLPRNLLEYGSEPPPYR